MEASPGNKSFAKNIQNPAKHEIFIQRNLSNLIILLGVEPIYSYINVLKVNDVNNSFSFRQKERFDQTRPWRVRVTRQS